MNCTCRVPSGVEHVVYIFIFDLLLIFYFLRQAQNMQKCQNQKSLGAQCGKISATFFQKIKRWKSEMRQNFGNFLAKNKKVETSNVTQCGLFLAVPKKGETSNAATNRALFGCLQNDPKSVASSNAATNRDLFGCPQNDPKSIASSNAATILLILRVVCGNFAQCVRHAPRVVCDKQTRTLRQPAAG